MGLLSRFGRRVDEVVARAQHMPVNPPDEFAEDGYLHVEDDRWWIRQDGHWVLHDPTEEEKADYLITLTAIHTKIQMGVAKSLASKLRTRLTKYRDSGGGSWSASAKVLNDFSIRLYVSENTMDIESEFTIDQDSLARATSSSDAFETFLDVVVVQLHALFTGTRTNEPVLTEEQRYEEMARLGLRARVPVTPAEKFQAKRAEVEAIESILSGR